jgi:hypothetical protein
MRKTHADLYCSFSANQRYFQDCQRHIR